MITTNNRIKAKGRRIQVSDKHGNVEVLSSVKAVCDVLKCTPSYVYLALRKGRLICGCKIEVVG